MVSKTLGDLLTEVSRTSGLDRMAAVAACTDTVIEALDRVRKDAGVNQFSLDELTETQGHVLAQILFYGQKGWECERGLSNWGCLIAQHPEVLEVPGLAEDLERLFKDAVKNLPDVMDEVAKELYPLHPPRDTLSVFWLGDDACSQAIPPGHSLWLALEVSDGGQWQSLPENEQVTRMLRSLRRNRLFLARVMLRLACNALERGSQSRENTVSLELLTDKEIEESNLQRVIAQLCAHKASDGERLQNFAELAGIDMVELTPRETERVLDLMDFFDWGGQNSSKTGVSFKEYYGGDSDSEKTQRNRLFKKIRRLTQEPSLQEP